MRRSDVMRFLLWGPPVSPMAVEFLLDGVDDSKCYSIENGLRVHVKPDCRCKTRYGFLRWR